MTAPVFVVPPQRLTDLAPGDVVVVDGPEGRHGATVRRLRAGETVALVDGDGARASGTVAAVPDRGRFDVRIATWAREPALEPRVTVVLALLKGDRMDSAVEMLTEVGVDEIVPWAARRSVARWRPDRAAKAHERLASTVRAAGKQSRRARFPVLAELADTAAVAGRIAAADCGLALHEEAPQPLAAALLPSSGEIVAIIGPEGGIAPEELAEFGRAGAAPVGLGPTVLRAGTAAAAGSALVLAQCGRWGGPG